MSNSHRLSFEYLETKWAVDIRTDQFSYGTIFEKKNPRIKFIFWSKKEGHILLYSISASLKTLGEEGRYMSSEELSYWNQEVELIDLPEDSPLSGSLHAALKDLRGKLDDGLYACLLGLC